LHIKESKLGNAVVGINMKYTRTIILLAIMSLSSSCIILPDPDIHKEQINQLQSQIAVGSTTREEIISLLGKPDVTRDRWVMYKRRIYEGGVLVALYGKGTVGVYAPGKELMDLYFEFDNYGTLTEFRTDKYDVRLRSDKDNWDPSKWDDRFIGDSIEEICDPGIESCT
jgi:hypothetical protein